jgi:hypothetical protein
MAKRSNIRITDDKIIDLPIGKATRPKPAKIRKQKTSFWTLTRIAAGAIILVTLVLVGLSLSHLADGVRIVTGCDHAPAWAMAIGIDLAFVALEVAILLSPEELRASVGTYASPAIKGTLILSALMNALAFASHATGTLALPGLAPSLALPMIYPAIVLGIAIPTLIYALTKTAALLALHKS